ncbi:Amino-acid acetyltransferase [BD1-7 clade bacterium]|uniref:Amino-acid acetyltransferase n=1 Tax=BD1-7 clade bacterium TaxID=2029982 RepID=A0A5S9Q3S3_9GAMM|nr:Amino-acid acetyltransferase [BD1-7 clade bacterium]
MSSSNSFVQAFRQSAPYINSHRGKTVVITLDGYALKSPNLVNIVHDIALLNSLGVRIVLVYGTRLQITERLDAEGIEYQVKNGIRTTSQEVMQHVKAISGGTRIELEALFSNGLPGTQMHGADISTVSGNFVSAKPLGVINGVDFHFTGTVRRIDHETINHLLDNRVIVLLSNIGYSSTGECFNVSSKEVAVKAAQALRADKLIVLARDQDTQGLPHEMMPEQARDILSQGNNPPLAALLNGARAGIPRNHMISLDEDGGLLSELFTRDGCGIMLSHSAFETIRQANSMDIASIMELLKPLEDAGYLVKRERELLEREINHFAVISRDNSVIACSALYPYDDGSAEVACVATHPDYRGDNKASLILDYLENKARSDGLEILFVLTTQSSHFFRERGYEVSSPDMLPQQKRDLYNWQRNSQILAKELN